MTMKTEIGIMQQAKGHQKLAANHQKLRDKERVPYNRGCPAAGCSPAIILEHINQNQNVHQNQECQIILQLNWKHLTEIPKTTTLSDF